MNRAGSRTLVIVGWLLTPIVAGAASFLGGWLGARFAPSLPPAGTGMVEMIAGGAVLALAAVTGWLFWLRHLGRPPAAPPRNLPGAHRDVAS